MANISNFQKRPPAGQSADDLKQEIGYPEAEDSNLGEVADPFLPNEPVPKKMPMPRQGGQPAEEGEGGADAQVPEFLRQPAAGQEQDYGMASGKAYETPAYDQYSQQGADLNADIEQQQETEGQGAGDSGQYAEQEQGAEYPEDQYEAPEANSERAAGIHKVATTAVDGLRKELELKIDALDEEIANLKTLESNVLQMQASLSGVEFKYQELAKKSAEVPEKVENEIDEIKASVDSMNATLSKALPALIKEIRSLRAPSLTFGDK